ncbi:MAG: N-methylproline demethylase, partial [Pseudomonadota bacterium]
IWDYGTRPADEIYHALAPNARNTGITDLEALAAGQAQPMRDAEGYDVHRIGDAVSSRNVHAAVTDALRLCQNC